MTIDGRRSHVDGIWANDRHWRETWTAVEKLPGGGQAEIHRASPKDDVELSVPNRSMILKVIRGSQKRLRARRARFYREATAYDTIECDGIPRLIQSNAQNWRDPEAVLYIAMEHIKGPTLRQWRYSQEHVDLSTAMRTTERLADVLQSCHDAGYVHRDIKPDNIILRVGDPGRPVLIDFGLAFESGDGKGFSTELGEELGNRFLRLPELSAGSTNKQDARSDVCFLAGVLFFLLTGRPPELLSDAQGLMPHQRPEPRTMLSHLAGDRLARLLQLFDQAFEPVIVGRFADVLAIKRSLEHVMASTPVRPSEEDLLRGIVQSLGTEGARRDEMIYRQHQAALEAIYRVHREVCDLLKTRGVFLNLTQGGRNVSGGTGRDTLSFVKPGASGSVLTVAVESRDMGDEIVVSLSGQPVYRVSTSSPAYAEDFDEAIRGWILRQLHEKSLVL